MILDQLANASLYQFKNPRLARGLEFLDSRNIATLPLGRTDIDGDHLFALVQEYPTRVESECAWEAHRKYIDIQFLVAGQERIDYAPASSLQISNPYDASKDRATSPAPAHNSIFKPECLLFFPPTTPTGPAWQVADQRRYEKSS